MEIQYLNPKELTPYEFNNKKHPKEQIDLLINSIKDFGFTQPVIVDKDYVIIIGHARTKAAEKLKLETIPVIVREDLDPIAIKKLRILDNKLSDLAERDKENLKIELEEIGDEELSQLFDDLDLDAPNLNKQDNPGILSEKFGVPPLSVLDTRQGYRQERKRQWMDILGEKGESREGTLMGSVDKSDSEVSQKIKKMGTVSILDPVLCEMMVKRFCPKNGKTFDTFAGDTIFGVVAAHLGNSFRGIELRQDQVDLNNEKIEGKNLDVEYICDDGQNVLNHFKENSMDFFFSCPPYYDLEVYSDDPKDASNQDNYEDFLKILEKSFTGACTALKDNCFAVVVMSNIRDKKGFYINICDDIKAIMAKNGLKFYNDMILLNVVGTVALRVNNMMKNRKAGRVHQNILVFYKGDAPKLKEDFNDTRESIVIHDNILVFYKGDPRTIQEQFGTIDGFDESEALLLAETSHNTENDELDLYKQ